MPAYTSSVRAVWIGVPESFLEERHRLGQDKKDELWEGVVHMVPPPSSAHMLVATRLAMALQRLIDRQGLIVLNSDPGVFRTDGTYRVPDIAVVTADRISSRGLEGAEVVVEVLSPDDESRDKFPFYAQVGVREIWLVEPSNRATEVYELVGGEYRAIPFVDGVTRSPVLGIELRVANDQLELRDGDERAVI